MFTTPTKRGKGNCSNQGNVQKAGKVVPESSFIIRKIKFKSLIVTVEMKLLQLRFVLVAVSSSVLDLEGRTEFNSVDKCV